MSANADIKIRASERDALNAFQALERQIRKTMNTMRDQTNRTKRRAKSTADTFAMWGNHLRKASMAAVGLGGAMGVVHSVATLVRREIEQIKEIGTAAKDKQLSFNAAMEQIRWQTPRGDGKTSDGKDVFDISVNEIRKRITAGGVGATDNVANAVLSATTAGLGTTMSSRVNTAIEVAQLRPILAQTDSEGYSALVEGVLENQRANPKQSVKSAVGLLSAALSASRLDDAGQFAKTIGALPAALSEFGVTQKEALALGAAVGTTVVDPEGTTTRTNITNFVSQLSSTLVRFGAKRADEKLTLDEQLDLVRADNETGQNIRNFLLGNLQQDMTFEEMKQWDILKSGGKLKGRAIGKVALMQLIQSNKVPDTMMKKLYEAAMAELPSSDLEAENRVNSIIGERGADPAFMISKLDYEGKQLDQRTQLAMTKEAIIERSNQIKSEARKNAGQGWLRGMMGWSEDYLGADAVEVGMGMKPGHDKPIERVEHELREIRRLRYGLHGPKDRFGVPQDYSLGQVKRGEVTQFQYDNYKDWESKRIAGMSSTDQEKVQALNAMLKELADLNQSFRAFSAKSDTKPKESESKPPVKAITAQ